MANLTNRLGLPEAIFNAVRNDGYSRGAADISVTGLGKPPRAVVLERLHEGEISEDVSDRIWSLIGQVAHGILERANSSGVAERRWFIQVEGWTVSGAVDHFENGVVSDYKTVTAWKFKGAGVPIEYERQLNCYAEMIRQHGEPVTRLQIIGILRDWSKMEARRDPEYPQTQVIVREVPLWSSEQCMAYLSERVRAHQEALITLPECSPEDRWEKPTTFAVMKEGAKRAVKLYEREQDAIDHASTSKLLRVEKRQGESTRCELYCAAAPFCSQYQSTKGSVSQKESE